MDGKRTRIEAYSFGRIVIAGREYTSDVIIYPDGRVQGSWWRASGHRLSLADIGGLVGSRPDVIVAGTGSSGMMVPDKELADRLRERGIVLESMPTADAVERYNRVAVDRRAGACLHLTC